MQTDACAGCARDFGGIVGVIPLNHLRRAKSRLATALSPDERAALALALAERVVQALRASGAVERIAVVSPDSMALAWAEAHGVTALRQPPLARRRARSGDLNAGLALARDWAVGQGAQGLLIALGDLPLLTPDEARRFVAMTRLYDRVVALAPDRAGEGTNLLLARPAALAPLAYGRGSFARHRRLAERLGAPTVVFNAPGAAFDVDTPADLDELIARGLWTPARRDGEAAMAPGTAETQQGESI